MNPTPLDPAPLEPAPLDPDLLKSLEDPSGDPERDLCALEEGYAQARAQAAERLRLNWLRTLTADQHLHQLRLTHLAGEKSSAAQVLTQILSAENKIAGQLKLVQRLSQQLSAGEQANLRDVCAIAFAPEAPEPHSTERSGAQEPDIGRPMSAKHGGAWRAAVLDQWPGVPSASELQAAAVWAACNTAQYVPSPAPPRAKWRMKSLDDRQHFRSVTISRVLIGHCFGITYAQDVVRLGRWTLRQQALICEITDAIGRARQEWTHGHPFPHHLSSDDGGHHSGAVRPGHPLVVNTSDPDWEEKSLAAIERLSRGWKLGHPDPEEPGCPWTPEQAYWLAGQD